ncbi:MAG TPA: BTAD domain-containing putative transcriptional regulator [Burkholderiaceae bacterium]|nr:BTAD domain-containing putative transcriptional regulator [Burkholderiaceae bacterium]
MPVTSQESDRPTRAGIDVRLLGPLQVVRGGQAVELPPSRKVRALLAYLALQPQAVTRSSLCDLLWDGVDDPRAELRWALSRLRAALGEDARLVARDDAMRIELADGSIDAVTVDDTLRDARPSDLDADRCRTLVALFRGDFLEGQDSDGTPHFNAWLTAERHRLREIHVALLARLVSLAPDDEALVYLERWRRLSPFDLTVHRSLLDTLARRGRVREAEEHVAAALRLFEDEGLDGAPLREAWRAARQTAPAPASALVEAAAPAQREATATGPRRASIAVMPFRDTSPVATPGALGDALVYDVIVRLAKLRALFVIAPGTVFELKARGVTPADAARLLDVDYVVGGSVIHDRGELRVDVELSDARAGRVVWAETLAQRQADALAVLEEIGDRLVGSIVSEVELLERNRAVLKPPNSLDAWESHHRGLWHMYRFNKADNEHAREFFQKSIQLDPTFSRAYAGLSFTYWQSAFQGWSERASAVERAFEAAGQSLLADERDPAAHWAMGRALWLRSQHEQCIAEIERAVDLSPNFALAHYALAFVHSQAGDPVAAVRAADCSRSLSPFDPLLFGMLGSRALALVRSGDYDGAAAAAVQAAARPNAHAHIHAIAAFSLALAGSIDEARSYAAAVRKSHPGYTVADFFCAFRFDARGIEAFRTAAHRLGMEARAGG